MFAVRDLGDPSNRAIAIQNNPPVEWKMLAVPAEPEAIQARGKSAVRSRDLH
jgi:hypothetical protein